MLDTTAKLRQNVIADKITMTLRIEFILSSLFPINDPMPFLVRCMTKTAGCQRSCKTIAVTFPKTVGLR
jgi:hypothetical protein